MNYLAPFLVSNPNLKEIRLQDCFIGYTGDNISSDAISNCSEDSLDTAVLSVNDLDDSDFDQLCLALVGCRYLSNFSWAVTG